LLSQSAIKTMSSHATDLIVSMGNLFFHRLKLIFIHSLIYRQRGGHVFCCFIDFSKAFDNVDCWLLFCKWLDYNKSTTCYDTDRLIAYWYPHQQMCIRWQRIAIQPVSMCATAHHRVVYCRHFYSVYIVYNIFN